MIPLRDDNPTSQRAYVTLALIALNVVVFLFVQPQSDAQEDIRFTYEYAAIPCEVISGEPITQIEFRDEDCDVAGDRSPEIFADKRVWVAMVISMFLHGDLLHIGFNMLFLWIFGNNVEDHLGRVRFVLFYFAGGIVATLAHIAVQPDSTIPVIGASGAVAAVMGAYLVWFPEAPISTLIFVVLIRVRAKVLLGIWLVFQFLEPFNPNSGIAWMAHVGGFVFGIAVGLLVRESRRVRAALWSREFRSDADGMWDSSRGGARDEPFPPYRGPIT